MVPHGRLALHVVALLCLADLAHATSTCQGETIIGDFTATASLVGGAAVATLTNCNITGSVLVPSFPPGGYLFIAGTTVAGSLRVQPDLVRVTVSIDSTSFGSKGYPVAVFFGGNTDALTTVTVKNSNLTVTADGVAGFGFSFKRMGGTLSVSASRIVVSATAAWKAFGVRVDTAPGTLILTDSVVTVSADQGQACSICLLHGFSGSLTLQRGTALSAASAGPTFVLSLQALATANVTVTTGSSLSATSTGTGFAYGIFINVTTGAGNVAVTHNASITATAVAGRALAIMKSGIASVLISTGAMLVADSFTDNAFGLLLTSWVGTERLDVSHDAVVTATSGGGGSAICVFFESTASGTVSIASRSSMTATTTGTIIAFTLRAAGTMSGVITVSGNSTLVATALTNAMTLYFGTSMTGSVHIAHGASIVANGATGQGLGVVVINALVGSIHLVDRAALRISATADAYGIYIGGATSGSIEMCCGASVTVVSTGASAYGVDLRMMVRGSMTMFDSAVISARSDRSFAIGLRSYAGLSGIARVSNHSTIAALGHLGTYGIVIVQLLGRLVVTEYSSVASSSSTGAVVAMYLAGVNGSVVVSDYATLTARAHHPASGIWIDPPAMSGALTVTRDAAVSAESAFEALGIYSNATIHGNATVSYRATISATVVNATAGSKAIGMLLGRDLLGVFAVSDGAVVAGSGPVGVGILLSGAVGGIVIFLVKYLNEMVV
jgi:hypothetical protein